MAAAPRIGTSLTYALSEAAGATFTVERRVPGRKVGTQCVAPKRSLRRNRACKRYVAIGGFSHSGQGGANTLTFSGRLNDRKLKPGTYRLALVATDAAGNASAPKRAKFKIVR